MRISPPTLPVLVLLLAVAMVPTASSAAPEGGVVASIKPVHSLVAMVMRDVGEAHLIVDGAASPHTYSLKPSDAARIEDAAVVFWVGPGLEAFLDRSLTAVGSDARVVALAETPGLETLAFREAGPFGHKEERGHGHDAVDGRGLEKEHGHGHEEGHDEARHVRAEGDGHGHGETDMHLWLDPVNAEAMVREIARVLAEADPENAGRYHANADAAGAEIEALRAEIDAALAPIRRAPFVVFHDGYQYFERRFGLNAVAAVTVSPEALAGAKRIAGIRATVARLGAVCVFSEPQFEPRLIAAITEGGAARAGVLDPLGADLPAGPAHYGDLLRGMARSLIACLEPGR